MTSAGLTGTSLSSVNSTAVIPRPTGETENALGKLQGNIRLLFENLNNMEDKLAPISRNSSPNKEFAVDLEFGTKLAQEINNCARDINVINEKMVDLRNRIEL